MFEVMCSEDDHGRCMRGEGMSANDRRVFRGGGASDE